VPLHLYSWRYAVFAIYLPLELCGGFFLAALFAVSHNTERCAYNLPKTDEEAIEQQQQNGAKGTEQPARAPCWAEMQIRTSCNWSCSNPLWLLASGGLNFQIEHHLFPGVAHKHYPALHPIVRAACAKRGIPYNAYESFADIFAAHLSMVRKLGHDEVGGKEEEEAKKGR
jgi:linoleoyl-CoA desaturase